jgi:heat shock protein HslJ
MLVLAMLALVSLIEGCDARGEKAGQLHTPLDPVRTEWTLTSLGGRSLIEGTHISLSFEEGYLGGSMTCNGYGGGPDGGRYTASDDGSLTLPRPLAATVQLCSSPDGIMEQEEAYIEALQSAAAYRVSGDRLEIDDAATATTLVFARGE